MVAIRGALTVTGPSRWWPLRTAAASRSASSCFAADIWIAASDARFAQLEVVDGADAARARAREIAHVIADRAEPLGIQATLASAHLARTEGDAAAVGRLRPEVTRLFGTADAAEGVQSFVERRPAQFRGYQPVAGRSSSPRTSSCAWRQRAGSWSRST
jgi:enoyl-CoA hydratase/carnithine racemase